MNEKFVREEYKVLRYMVLAPFDYPTRHLSLLNLHFSAWKYTVVYWEFETASATLGLVYKILKRYIYMYRLISLHFSKKILKKPVLESLVCLIGKNNIFKK